MPSALGEALLELGRPLESIEALRKAAALNSDDPSPFFLLARAYGKCKAGGIREGATAVCGTEETTGRIGWDGIPAPLIK